MENATPYPLLKSTTENLRVVVRDPTLRLPVVNWLWGGWYLQGGKDNQYPGTPNFNGSAVVANSNNSLIYVAGKVVQSHICGNTTD